jgi:hypothetical protein
VSSGGEVVDRMLIECRADCRHASPDTARVREPNRFALSGAAGLGIVNRPNMIRFLKLITCVA